MVHDVNNSVSKKTKTKTDCSHLPALFIAMVWHSSEMRCLNVFLPGAGLVPRDTWAAGNKPEGVRVICKTKK